MTARVLPRRKYRRRLPNARITGICRVCQVPFQLNAHGALFRHGPLGAPPCPGSGQPAAPERFPTVLDAIRAAEARLHISEWRRLPPQPGEKP